MQDVRKVTSCIFLLSLHPFQFSFFGFIYSCPIIFVTIQTWAFSKVDDYRKIFTLNWGKGGCWLTVPSFLLYRCSNDSTFCRFLHTRRSSSAYYLASWLLQYSLTKKNAYPSRCILIFLSPFGQRETVEHALAARYSSSVMGLRLMTAWIRLLALRSSFSTSRVGRRDEDDTMVHALGPRVLKRSLSIRKR